MVLSKPAQAQPRRFAVKHTQNFRPLKPPKEKGKKGARILFLLSSVSPPPLIIYIESAMESKLGRKMGILRINGAEGEFLRSTNW